ncbi:MAG: type II restriction endonuclease [Ignavibacteriae bacterium]|nr:type II restriction endonuclease [Ignavibacteriota bacterium]
MKKKQKLGSETAKQGFKNEKEIVSKFNNWGNDIEAKSWLQTMDYKLSEIELVEAVVLSGYKTDVQVQVTIKLKKAIDVENLQVKLVSNLKGFNQIDKRWVDKYVEMWSIPNDIIKLLKKYTGELKPTIKNPKDNRRTFVNEFSKVNQNLLLKWLENNKTLIVNDIIKGRGKFSAEWMLVAQKIDINARWILKPINVVVNHFGNGDVVVTKQGNIKIGRITMQRKGGDGGRETAKMLQFKINPAELFEIKNN